MARFQELECWQEAAALAVEVYALTSTGAVRRDYGLCDQLRRSAISIASNIAEEKERKDLRASCGHNSTLQEEWVTSKANALGSLKRA